MQKKILIIGNSDGLPGVKVDMESYKGFFKSHCGGNWYDFEISTMLNARQREVTDELDRLKRLSLDYSIIIFSGHGGQERETILELNSAGELLPESALSNISVRQLTIFDCCRAYAQPLRESRMFAEVLNKGLADNNTRARYEARIMQAIPQQVNLYACKKGECAYDDATGGIYSSNLIQSARNIQSDFKLVGNAHEEASPLTTKYVKDVLNKEQQPEAILPRCLSSQQLILSIKP